MEINLNGNVFKEITDSEWKTPIWWCEELKLQIDQVQEGLKFYRGAEGWDSGDPIIWELEEALRKWEKATPTCTAGCHDWVCCTPCTDSNCDFCKGFDRS
jgi:hypothetical protein